MAVLWRKKHFQRHHNDSGYSSSPSESRLKPIKIHIVDGESPSFPRVFQRNSSQQCLMTSTPPMQSSELSSQNKRCDLRIQINLRHQTWLAGESTTGLNMNIMKLDGKVSSKPALIDVPGRIASSVTWLVSAWKWVIEWDSSWETSHSITHFQWSHDHWVIDNAQYNFPWSPNDMSKC